MNVQKNNGLNGRVPIGFKLYKTINCDARINELVWSPDGTKLAWGSNDNVVRVWDIQKETTQTFPTNNAWIWCLAWSPDNRLLASGSGGQTIDIWDTQNNKIYQKLRKHTGSVFSLAWSSDGLILASSSIDGIIYLWDPKTGEPKKVLEGDYLARSTAWSRIGPILASGYHDNSIRLWAFGKNGIKVNDLIGHQDLVYSLAWSPDGNLLASSSADRSIRIWNPKMGLPQSC